MKRELSKSKRIGMYMVVLLFFLSALLLVFPSQTAKASYQDGDYTYTITDGEATITGYTGAGGDVEIPDTLDSHTVIAIGNDAFRDHTSLTSITIPDSVISIGNNAFRGCTSLTSIAIPDSVTSIGFHAFFECTSLTSITIPRGVPTIRAGTFGLCISLVDITIPDSVSDIGSSAFWGCTSLTSIIIPDGVTTINDHTFSNCTSLTSITIPDSVTTIKDAFFNCTSLNSITLSRGVQHIWSPVFRGCTNLTEINVHTDNPYYMSLEGVLFNKTGNTLIKYPAGKQGPYAIPDNVTTIRGGAFSECTSLTSITIPESVTSIGGGAFRNCYSLIEITIPDSVTSIGGEAFMRCTSLTSIIIPDSVTTIGGYAFQGCTSLTSIIIPGSVTSIGSAAFLDCTNLTEINVHTDNQNYMSLEGVLFNKASRILIQYPAGKQGPYAIPDSVTSIGSEAFRRCTSLTSIIIPGSVQTIGQWAFQGCTSLTSIALSSGLQTIGIAAFRECTSLTSITIPESVTSIGSGAFFDCTKLTEINVHPDNQNYMSLEGVLFNKAGSMLIECPAGKQGHYAIPDSVTSIGDYAFRGCTSLTSITMPNSVQIIGDSSFWGCTSLTSITIPGSVRSISHYAFARCSSLAEITFLGLARPTTGVLWLLGTNPDLRGHAYYGSNFPEPGQPFNGLMMGGYFYYEYTITNGQATITKYLNRDSTGVTIPETLNGCPVTAIGDNAFQGCSSLTSLTIPGGVTSVGSSPFAGCDNLYGITFLGLTPPATDTGWMIGTNPDLRGHAYYGSSFPKPGELFNGLIMGDYIPEDYHYTITNGKATITSYIGTSGDVTIPATLGGCPVTAIGDKAFFRQARITSVVIPDNIISIGNNAFERCSALASVTIPDSLTSIGSNAFSNCSSLTSITIPDGVTSIGAYAFYGCSSLTSVTIPDGVRSIGAYAFYGCSSLTRVTLLEGVQTIGDFTFNWCSSLTEITIPNSVTSIGSNAFQGCSALASVTIPDSVTRIGNMVFADCSSLTLITIPGGVTSIGDFAFMGCTNLTEINVHTGNPNYMSLGGVLFNKTGSTLVHYPPGKQDISYAIPAGVTTIGNGAFATCSALTSITIPGSVTGIGDGAFYECSSLTSITIPDSVTSIGDSAFASCSSLTSVTIPDGITNIGKETFAYCDSLESITIPGTVTSIGDYAFFWCESLVSITLPDSITDIGRNAFHGCSSLTGITIPGGVTSIRESTFAYCSSLKDITIPDSVTSIGFHAFDGCTSLTTIRFLGLTSPIVDSSSWHWLSNTSDDLRGHAYFDSNFPRSGESFNGLLMGSYLADVTFSQAGIDPLSTTGIVLTVNGTSYQASELPITFTWYSGDEVEFSWSEVVGINSGARYRWHSSEGLSDFRSGRITVPDEGGAVAASYEIEYAVAVEASPARGGSVSGRGFYTQGTLVTVTATPKKGYSFASWTEDGEVVSTNPEYTFNITASRSLVANFTRENAPATFTVTVAANPRQGGSVSGGGTYSTGDWVTVTATPKKGYSFESWTENGEVVSAEATYPFEMGTESRHLVANFLR